MALEKNVNVLALVHDNRQVILEELDRVKKAREKMSPQYKKACIYLASVVQAPRSKKEPNPRPKVKVKIFNVHGGHKKAESVINLQRNGKFPIGYDFPTDAQLEAAKKAAARNTDGLVLGDVARLASDGEDPYGELRRYCDQQIQMLLGGWKAEDKMSELEKRAAEAEQRVNEAELKLSKLLEQDAKKQKEAKAEKQEKDLLKQELEANK